MDDKLRNSILKEYSDSFDLYEGCADEVRKLISIYARKEGILVHAISHRAKNIQNLSEKLSREGKNYKNLKEITDLAGIRITTYFPDDVDKIAAVVLKEFEEDKDNSVDKRLYDDPSRFGYTSLHLVCEFTDDSCKRREYEDYKGIKFEIQIRSILQHAWAEIEHDLGYKSSGDVPRSIRRKFARVAGLLETADDVFEQVRRELLDYEKSLPELIKMSPQKVDINKLSLKVFAQIDESVNRLDKVIAACFETALRPIDSDYVSSLSKIMQDAGIKSIQDVTNVLSTYANRLDKFIRNYAACYPNRKFSSLSEGVSLYHIVYIFIMEKNKNSKKLTAEFLRKNEIHTPVGFEQGAENLINAWASSSD